MNYLRMYKYRVLRKRENKYYIIKDRFVAILRTGSLRFNKKLRFDLLQSRLTLNCTVLLPGDESRFA